MVPEYVYVHIDDKQSEEDYVPVCCQEEDGDAEGYGQSVCAYVIVQVHWGSPESESQHEEWADHKNQEAAIQKNTLTLSNVGPESVFKECELQVSY